MVAVTSGKLLITGGSGYIGAWIVKSAVDRGYSVVAAVRTDSQGQFLVNRFPEYHGKVSYVLIPVIEKDGAYDEAVKDVDGIIHAASPVILKWDNPEAEVLRPAIRGALGILESARKYGKNVKRIVLTSSGAAIGMPIERDGKMTVWNTLDTAQFEALGKNSSPLTVYFASKTYAEQSSWAWVKEHKPSWDFVTILPPLIFGPYIHQPGKPHFGSSPGLLLEKALGVADTSGTYTNDCADVRDTADFHLLALENPDASGERVLIGPGEWFPESLGGASRPGVFNFFFVNRLVLIALRARDSRMWMFQGRRERNRSCLLSFLCLSAASVLCFLSAVGE
ncbi:hypothetical protein BS47DRAFT_1389885 [Hydnum rufescens UP504]|uniref:NAD-dependent epimerase/dehydratase domain-containing protein n=1 Tax=Hydnum rufescens UP504 TaxID=1448309 RepID=A0A9P6B439_9AGAM|nr:hypothetical protein BS47DRAFT_1389885 [Hydnum rufescens UP504]